MKFNKPSGYDAAEVLPENGHYAKLPRGGYVAKILSVEEKESRAGNQYLIFSLDIAEGEYMGFFAYDYANQTGDKKWRFEYRMTVPNDRTKPYCLHLFKTVNTYLEESNPGWKFAWELDERQYRGKLIGVLVNERQYEKRNGFIGMVTNIAKLVKASTIRNGSYTVPDDVLLVKPPKEQDFVPDSVDDDDLPFA